MNQYVNKILKFMPRSQALCFMEGLRGSEGSYFNDVAKRISEIIAKAPDIYETDGKGEEVKPVIHYFYGNVDIYITEVDKDSREHFGYTSIGHGLLEAGYVDLDYIFKSLPLINLDFDFKPLKISEYKNKYEG